jgi:hypothetical protein
MESRTTEGERPVTENWRSSRDFLSNATRRAADSDSDAEIDGILRAPPSDASLPGERFPGKAPPSRCPSPFRHEGAAHRGRPRRQSIHRLATACGEKAGGRSGIPSFRKYPGLGEPGSSSRRSASNQPPGGRARKRSYPRARPARAGRGLAGRRALVVLRGHSCLRQRSASPAVLSPRASDRVLGQIGFGVIPPGTPGGGWGAAEATTDSPEPCSPTGNASRGAAPPGPSGARVTSVRRRGVQPVRGSRS